MAQLQHSNRQLAAENNLLKIKIQKLNDKKMAKISTEESPTKNIS